MSHRTRRAHGATLVAAALAATLTLTACADDEAAQDTVSSTQVTAAEDAPQGQADDRIGVQRKTFEVEEVDPVESDKTNGERVEDPAMELSYKWQGTAYSADGGAIVVVAITNESDAPLPLARVLVPDRDSGSLLVLAILAKKDATGFLAEFHGLARDVVAVPMTGETPQWPPTEIASIAEAAGFRAKVAAGIEPALSGPTLSTPKSSAQAIEPPPAPRVSTWIIGMPIR